MSEAAISECLVRTIDSRRGTVDFVSEKFVGKTILSDTETGVQVIHCGIEGCDAIITIGGKPEANRKPWEIIEKIYDTAAQNCDILKLSESA